MLRRHRLPVALAFLLASSLAAQRSTYDALGRLIWSTQPNGDSTVFSYDPNGNINAVTRVVAGMDTDADGIQDWFEIHFTGSVGGLDANVDPQANGLTHIVRFALGLSPFQPDYAEIVTRSTGLNPEGAFVARIHYHRPKPGPQTVAYTHEVSYNLTAWSSNPQDIAVVAVEDLGQGMEKVTVEARMPDNPNPETNPTLFLRLRIEQQGGE